MSTIHWLGAGLSTRPGIRRLATGDVPLVIWNRTLSKAESALQGLDTDTEIRQLDIASLSEQVKPGDIVVSMLPQSWHIQVAQLAIENSAHFVSSSYISDEMRALDTSARKKQLSIVNEVGLDPGLDHLMAHALINLYRQSDRYNSKHSLRFRSYCGGFPKYPNAFRYKFSWSPLGVLKALKSPSRSIRNGDVVEVVKPWEAITAYEAKLPNGEETFQAYPNRDSLPFVEEYNFAPDWKIEEFVRGTLRLNGWTDAWESLFVEIDEANEQRLQEISNELWQTEAYEKGEPDRVVLCVELEAQNNGKAVWHQGYALDACGNERGSAMARLVSLPVSLAVQAVHAGRLPTGVVGAPSSLELINEWFAELHQLGEEIHSIDYMGQ